MKKILALTVSLLMTATMFAACSDDSDETTEETTTTEVTTEATTEETTEESEEENQAPVLESDNSLAPIVQAAYNVGKWPLAMSEITDAQTLKDFFNIDVENPDYKNVIVCQNMMSAPFVEIIVIEAADGKAQAVADELEARRDEKLNDQMLYPETVENLEAAKIGVSGNYAYYIATFADDVETVESAVIEAIGTM